MWFFSQKNSEINWIWKWIWNYMYVKVADGRRHLCFWLRFSVQLLAHLRRTQIKLLRSDLCLVGGGQKPYTHHVLLLLLSASSLSIQQRTVKNMFLFLQNALISIYKQGCDRWLRLRHKVASAACQAAGGSVANTEVTSPICCKYVRIRVEMFQYFPAKQSCFGTLSYFKA